MAGFLGVMERLLIPTKACALPRLTEDDLEAMRESRNGMFDILFKGVKWRILDKVWHDDWCFVTAENRLGEVIRKNVPRSHPLARG